MSNSELNEIRAWLDALPERWDYEAIHASNGWGFVLGAPRYMRSLLAERDALAVAYNQMRDVLASLIDTEDRIEPGGYLNDRNCTQVYSCVLCECQWLENEPEHHDVDCPIGRARALLREASA